MKMIRVRNILIDIGFILVCVWIAVVTLYVTRGLIVSIPWIMDIKGIGLYPFNVITSIYSKIFFIFLSVITIAGGLFLLKILPFLRRELINSF